MPALARLGKWKAAFRRNRLRGGNRRASGERQKGEKNSMPSEKMCCFHKGMEGCKL
jgi:hypothetical protein